MKIEMKKAHYIGPFNSEQELFVIGEVHGVDIGVEQMGAIRNVNRLLEMSKFYVEAYMEYFGEMPPPVFNAEYGENNLSYLYQNWDNGEELYRIAVPFSGQQSEKVQDSQFIAGFRSLLEYRGESESDLGPAVLRLLEFARY